MSLSAPAITELTTLSAPKALFKEWLESYFDGSAHAVGLHAPVTFPRCTTRFSVSLDDQPLADRADAPNASGCSIRMVMHPRGEKSWWTRDVLSGLHKRTHTAVVLHFWVKAKIAGEGASDYTASKVAELLKAILTNPDARYPLVQKGVRAFEVRSPQALPEAGAALYLVSCAVEFHYAQLAEESESIPPTLETSDAQSDTFTFDNPALAGGYLLGLAQWEEARTVTRITAVALGGAAATVLELEVDGVLTGVQVTLPDGLEQSVQGENPAPDYIVPAGVVVRWKIISASSDPEQAAWKISLALETVETVTQSATFVRDVPAVSGSYLLGLAQWAEAMTVERVQVAGLAGLDDTVLELEVDGVLTGVQVTLPAGTLEQSVTGENVAPGYTIPAAGVVRWKIIDAPAVTAESSWQISLAMEVTS